jgi:hypothetical protein
MNCLNLSFCPNVCVNFQRLLGNEKEEDVYPAKERSVTVQDTSTAKMEENQL